MTLSTKANYGAFRDSLKAPIHKWFTYPAGYSYKLVNAKLDEHGIGSGCLVLDPFLGTGTTSLAAKMRAVDSVGIEAHPYVHQVARTKLTWCNDASELAELATEIVTDAHVANRSMDKLPDYPELVHKCFTAETLRGLSAIKESIAANCSNQRSHEFFELALAATLRLVTTAGAGWPYIAPSKHARRKTSHDPFEKFAETAHLMISDLIYVESLNIPPSTHQIYCDDAKNIDAYTDPGSVDIMITSPPYLNNYDYADRTRLETYFLGKYSSWADISLKVRSKLMISATTQITLRDMQHLIHLPKLRGISPKVVDYLRPRIDELFAFRNAKPGRKTYDILVAGYFEDMAEILNACYRVLKPQGTFTLVIGDSAPYGVHVETEKVLGEIAIALGFSDYEVEVIRSRGEKWAGNSQRHNVKLKESILTITK